MKLVVNRDAEVRLEYRTFWPQCDTLANHVAVLLIKNDEGYEETRAFHDQLFRILKSYFGASAVMEEIEPEEGYTEICVLNGTMLGVVDLLRLFSYGVQECWPNPEDDEC